MSKEYQQAFANSDAEMRRRNNALAQSGALTSSLQNFANQYVGDNAGYRKQVQNGMESSANARFDDARSATRARANLAGFGYTSPVSTAGEDNVELERARELSRIPLAADEAAFSRGMQAAGLQQGNVAATQREASMYDPQGWFNTGAEMKEKEDARKNALWQSLAGLGLGIATAPVTGGGSLLGNIFK